MFNPISTQTRTIQVKTFRLIALFIGFLGGGLTVAHADTAFTYSLAKAGTTSAGVYSTNGALLRTLWFNVPKPAGVNTGTWDNLDDDGKPVASGNYEMRVLAHNMEYRWDGLVGNSSRDMAGTTIHKGMYPIRDITISGTKAFYTSGYNEAMYDFHRFDTRDPQVRLHSWTWVRDTRAGPNFIKQYDCYGPVWSFTTTDGANVYWACPAGWNNATNWSVAPGYIVANRVADDTQSEAFTHGKELPFLGTPYVYPRGIQVGTQAGISGLAVQPTGQLLAVAVAPDKRVYLLDKLSGDVLSSFPVENPRRMTFDASNNLWIAAVSNVYYYSVSGAPTLLKTLAGFSNALAVAVSPIADLVVVADGGGSMQLKAFTTGGKPLWTYGQPGGMPEHGPAVTDDKLWFFPESIHSLIGGEDTFITFEPDGAFWVGDSMTARTLKLSAKGGKPRVVDRISMQPMCYKISADQNNPTRVFRNFLEFKVDYRKPLRPDNGSWKLVNNWAAKRPAWSTAAPDDSGAGLDNVTTLKNGRTYAYLYRHDTDTNGVTLAQWHELVELTKTGLRPTGLINRGTILEDGSLFHTTPNGSNGSFETGDVIGWSTWTSGNPTKWSATARQSPGKPTDGDYYLHLQANGPTTAGAIAVSLGQALSWTRRSMERVITLSFDFQNQTNGFDQAIIELLTADSKGGVTASVHPAPTPALHPDGAWHSYSMTFTVPPKPTEYSLQLRISFLKHGAVAGNVYEANLDNVAITQSGGRVLVDRGVQRWYRAPLTGFDQSGNPQWGPASLLASLYQLPGSLNPAVNQSVLSSRGFIACYEPGFRNIRHLGGIRVGETNWAWRSFPSTNTPWGTKTYPVGYYDLGNGLATGGNIPLVSGRHIIAGYHGEGWRGNQANQFMHFHEDGLFIGQFGLSGMDAEGRRWPADDFPGGYAGNSFSPVLVKVRDELYVYLNDEWGSPLQRFHLIGANDIRELSGSGPLDSTIKLSPMKR